LVNIAGAAAGFTIVPSNTIARPGYKAPDYKLNIAGVDIGNAIMITFDIEEAVLKNRDGLFISKINSNADSD
jgi:uncharacterized protein (DUF736 family)